MCFEVLVFGVDEVFGVVVDDVVFFLVIGDFV